MVSEERKKELIAIINQNENNWAGNYSMFTGGLTASRDLSFPEPLPFCVAGRTYLVDRAKLMVVSGGNADGRIRFYPKEDTWSYLSDVVRDSDITDEADIEIGLALSFMSNELSRKMMSDLKSSPTNDVFLNLMSRFLK